MLTFNRYVFGLLCVTCCILTAASAGRADDPPSAVGPVLKLLKSGRVPESNRERIVELICSKGNEHDLAYVFEQTLSPETWPTELRISVLESLRAASANRKVIPAGDLSGITGLITQDNPQLQQLAIGLAGDWKITAAAPVLQKLATSNETPAGERYVALQSLLRLDATAAKATILQLLSPESDFRTRTAAVSGLLTIAPDDAAHAAANVLASAGERDDPRPLIDAFLDQQGGADLLAKALTDKPPTADVAKLALRHMYSVGRSDKTLSDVLGKIAGISEDMPVPNADELAALIDEVRSQGDPHRGEKVFRRKDLSCMKCHSVSKAGGQVGPDLSAVGASSPVEYLAMSVLDPDQAIKEAYTTKVVLTLDGKVIQGIIHDQTDDTLVLKDTNGHLTSIPLADIEDQINGKSLMPKGLVKFMTHAELIDLIAFLAELGKPGDFAIRQSQRMQRWQILTQPNPGLLSSIPNILEFEDEVLAAKTWESVYAQVDGNLPLEELTDQTGNAVLYLSAEFDVTKAGAIELQTNRGEGISIWIGKDALASTQPPIVTLPAGRHRITYRIDRGIYSEPTLSLTLTGPAGSSAAFSVVDGQ